MQVIYTITTLGVADVLKAGPQTAEEIAGKLGEHMVVGSSDLSSALFHHSFLLGNSEQLHACRLAVPPQQDS